MTKERHMAETMAATRPEAGVRHAASTAGQAARRVWLAGLGGFAIAAEQARNVFAALEHKGEQLEPSVSEPLKRAGERASRVAERAGTSVKSVGGAVSSATNSMADVGRRLRTAGLTEEVQRLIDDKLAAALKRLDIPTKADLQALADRIEALTSKGKRTSESHLGH